MPIRSMTGVGQAQVPIAPHEVGDAAHSGQLDVELRSINSRFLECAIKAPVTAVHEQALQRRLAARLGRGRVELRMNLSTGGNAQASESSRLRELLKELAQIDTQAQSHWMQLAPVNALEIRRELRKMLSEGGASGDPLTSLFEQASAREQIGAAVDQALDRLVLMREQEGARLAAQIEREVQELRLCSTQVQERRLALIPEWQARLQERMTSILQGPNGARVHEVGEARVAQELAVLLARADVEEELIRIDAHLHQVSEILDETPQVGQGKRLNFLCQELGREWSTLGAKVSDSSAGAVVVTAKTHIERIREQAQNVE